MHRREAGTRKGPLKNANFSSPSVVLTVLGSALPKVTRTVCPWKEGRVMEARGGPTTVGVAAPCWAA